MVKLEHHHIVGRLQLRQRVLPRVEREIDGSGEASQTVEDSVGYRPVIEMDAPKDATMECRIELHNTASALASRANNSVVQGQHRVGGIFEDEWHAL